MFPGPGATMCVPQIKHRSIPLTCRAPALFIFPQIVEALDQMNKGFQTPYIIFYPHVSRDGMPFPINKCIREIQGNRFNEARAWRGNIVVAKYRDTAFASMMDASMADFPIVKNYLANHEAP